MLDVREIETALEEDEIERRDFRDAKKGLKNRKYNLKEKWERLRKKVIYEVHRNCSQFLR